MRTQDGKTKAERALPGAPQEQDTLLLRELLRELAEIKQKLRNSRIFGPDESVCNDEVLKQNGKLTDSMLSEHQPVPAAEVKRAQYFNRQNPPYPQLFN